MVDDVPIGDADLPCSPLMRTVVGRMLDGWTLTAWDGNDGPHQPYAYLRRRGHLAIRVSMLTLRALVRRSLIHAASAEAGRTIYELTKESP